MEVASAAKGKYSDAAVSCLRTFFKQSNKAVFNNTSMLLKMAAVPCWTVLWVFHTQHFSTALVAISTSVRWPAFLGLTPHRTATQNRERKLSAPCADTRFVVSCTSLFGADGNADCNFSSANSF